jgi:hypothetical protein
VKTIKIKTVEQEINEIRLEIFEETKNMTLEQRKERLSGIVDDAQKKFGFKRVVAANNRV